MPGFEHGFNASIKGLVTGLFQSVVLLVVVAVAGTLQTPLNTILVLASILSFLGLAHRMNYWGITYTVGLLLGLTLLGPSIINGWELYTTEALGFFYVGLKVYHKAVREYSWRF